MYSYLSVTLPPASSISFFKDSASALAIPSFTVFGADSTSVFASPRPRPVAFLTTLRTLIFAAASKLSRTTSNSVFSSAAPSSPSPPAAPGAAITTPAEAAADTPKASSICFTSSDASKSDKDFNDSRISSVFADIFLKVN
ncbi:Hypothetical protein P9215_02191 [Prochlorococcus marinus str. MIT 9215]|uniref:50S ribosomal protein L7/L12 n=1 Tax=Prochlorococcus marinus (strain MIT 9215) TaxID=93060 RepID=A8G2K7_PROM2|nr:Hypothetical protein P9215_02191 [Prochlorococcus marinus str. MIT 9215]